MSEEGPVGAYHVQLRLHHVLERLLGKSFRVFRTSLDRAGRPVLQVAVEDGERLADEFEVLTGSHQASSLPSATTDQEVSGCQ